MTNEGFDDSDFNFDDTGGDFGFDGLGGSSNSSNSGFGGSSGSGLDDFGGSSNSGLDTGGTMNNNMGNSQNSMDDFGGDDSSFGGNSDFGSQSGDTSDGASILKKNAIKLIILGIVVFIIVIFIGLKFFGKSKSTDEKAYQQQSNQVAQSNTTDNTMDGANKSNRQSASDILSSDSNENNSDADSQKTVTTIIDDSNVKWTEITDSEKVTFNSDYKDMTFTITGIKHYARPVDTNNNLVIKTTLLGSISGLSGTYYLDVPYDKGVKLVVGDDFTVHVQLGTYNDKIVVGEIKY